MARTVIPSTPFPMLRFSPRLALMLGLAGGLCVTAANAAPAGVDARFVLSTEGSGRATAYAPTNKIVTRDGRTHVTWLDSTSEGFLVRIRTLDRGTGEWSPVVTIGRAQDNHGGAALTIDPEGYLHALYFPHHEAMRYRRSVRPNDASAWTTEEVFGEALTYPVVMSLPDGTLLMTARRSYDGHEGFTPPGGSHAWEAELWRRRPGGRAWERVGPLLRGRFSGYVQFAEALWWGEDGRTLHLSARIYETNYRGNGELFTTVGYLMSPDGGTTWQRRDGTRVTLPATADTLDVIARGGTATSDVLATGGLIVDADDRPRVLYSQIGEQGARLYLASPAPDGSWQSRDLAAVLPPEWAGWELNVPGAITRSSDGTVTITATLQRVPPGETWWAHRSNEVARLWSRDGGRTFQFEAFGPPDPSQPRWLPNVERATGQHEVPGRPGIIYTDGPAGAGNDALLNNQVIWQPGAR
jgi:hypothetical protein